MCGIIGYYGPLSPKDVIISGLKKLEYRGYDSAGLAIIDKGHIRRVRAQGKLIELEKKVQEEVFTGQLGIGHTRWATHGPPSERNAHPHQVGEISLVHNGIIENYLEIREELLAKGAMITSDTDSELVAHLISEDIKKSQNLHKAVENVLQKIRGAFSIVVIWEKEPDHMIAFKNGPPMVIGVSDEHGLVASDVQALLQYTKKFIYLDDFEVASIRKNQVEVFSANGFPVKKKVTELNWDPEMVEKQGFSHYMLKEIYEQPRAVANAIDPHINIDTMTIRLAALGFGIPLNQRETINIEGDWVHTQQTLKKIERIFIVACGTSNYAGMMAKYTIESLARLPVECDIASEFRYRNPVIPPNTLLITISQSGETADTLAAIKLAKEKGAMTLSLCNVHSSSIDREAHGHLYMNSGPEIGVASTKAFVSSLAVLNCLAIGLGRIKNNLTLEAEQECVRAMTNLPSQMEVVLAYDKYFLEAAQELKSYRGFLYMGRGVSYPIAMEGALKLKELAYMHAEGYASGEMKHGPLALIDHRMAIIMVAPTDEHYEKTVSNLEEARARGGEIISIGTGENDKLKTISKRYLGLPKAHWMTNPILSVVPLQLMAFHLASSLGYDVDQPRNLAKSVTVE
jgi:glucosamine--fructose-6-phosphate aminotransferase (isomerizing)